MRLGVAGPFRFRLEAVLRAREAAVESWQRRVADALREQALVEDRMANGRDEMRRLAEQGREGRDAAVLDMTALRARELHRGWLHRRLAEVQHDLEAARRRVAGEQAGLVEARKELKVIEKLRERQWRRHLAMENKAEQAASDESALRQFLRGRAEWRAATG